MASDTTKKRSAETRAKQSAAAKANRSNTEMYRRFVKNYLGPAKLNGTEAVLMMDPDKSRAAAASHAFRLLEREDVQAMLAEERALIADKYDVTRERIIRELALLGFSNMQDYGRVTGDGLFQPDLSATDRDQFAAIGEITSRRIASVGEDEPDIIETKLKLADKGASLDRLAKIMGLYKEAPDVNLNVSFTVIRTERSRRA